MRIAIPVTEGKVPSHFGHCEHFAIIEVDTNSKEIKCQQLLAPPPHEPGLLPEWLSRLSVDLVITGGIGRRAQQLFKQRNIDVVVGTPDNSPYDLVVQYLAGQLQSVQNICDH